MARTKTPETPLGRQLRTFAAAYAATGQRDRAGARARGAFMSRRGDPFCRCGRPQSAHECGVGGSPSGCTAFRLRGRGSQLEVLGCIEVGDPPRRAPTYMVQCRRCGNAYPTRAYLRDIVVRRSCRRCADERRRGRPSRPCASRPTDLPPAHRFTHGTRSRYVAGCRCEPCTTANREYARAQQKRVRGGDGNPIVPATRVRAHLRRLADQGIGKRAVADVARVPVSSLHEIRMGRKTKLRRRTAERILAVTAAACLDDGHTVDARATWKLIGKLLEQGFTRQQIARRIGSTAKTPALQLKKDRVTARTARKVERLYAEVMR